MPSAELLRTIAANSGSVPAPALVSLAKSESSFDATQINPTSGASGLFQITPAVLADYNRAKGTHATPRELTDPALNTRVAAWHLETIVKSYAKTPALVGSWTDPRWLGLVIFGYNAGWADSAGVPYVVRKIVKAGLALERITAASVAEAARAMPKPAILGAHGWKVQDAGRAAWAQKVADRATGRHVITDAAAAGIGVGLGLALLLGVLLAGGKTRA